MKYFNTGKPFNPLLGETYEYIDTEKKFKFISEQVSHHPPIGACFAEGQNWKFYQSQKLNTRFTGNSLDCSVDGSSNVVFTTTNDHFKWEGIRYAFVDIMIL